MPKFRKKPVVIEAVLWDDSWESFDMIQELDPAMEMERDGDKIFIETLEGVMTASLGDWIIKGVKGELYPCKPDIFKETYEAVER